MYRTFDTCVVQRILIRSGMTYDELVAACDGNAWEADNTLRLCCLRCDEQGNIRHITSLQHLPREER